MIPLRDKNPTRRTAWVTIALIVVNVGVYFLVQPGSTSVSATAEFSYHYAAIPCEVTTGQPLSADEIVAASRGISDHLCERHSDLPPYFPDKHVYLAVLFSMFFHGGLLHLGGNMLFLWIFGNNVEDHLGRGRYLLFYLAAGLVAALGHIAAQANSTVPVVGASGAIAGVMGAYLVWFPDAPVLTAFVFFFIFLRDIAAKWLLAFWFLSQFFVNPNEGVAWVAHVVGFVFGALVAVVLRAAGGTRRPVYRV